MNEQDAADQTRAAVSFGYLAAQFVVQPESWPVFLAYARMHGIGQDFDFTREIAIELISVLFLGLNVAGEMTFEAQQ